jgi:hypothetical protein
MNLVSRGPGRPKKFGRPSRAVTLTLPDDVLDRLGRIDTDLGRAIVALAERARLSGPRVTRPAELASYGRRSVIVVTPGRALKHLDGVQLVPIGNGRALISLDRPHSVPQLELEIRDALEHDDVRQPERRTFEAIADILRHARLSERVDVEERTIIVLESKRQRRAH